MCSEPDAPQEQPLGEEGACADGSSGDGRASPPPPPGVCTGGEGDDGFEERIAEEPPPSQ